MVFGVVTVGDGLVIVRAMLQYRELLVQISGKEGEQRDYREDDVGDERVCAGGKGGCETTILSVCSVGRMLNKARRHT